MKTVSFIHTQFNTEVIVYTDQIFCAMIAPTMKSVVLVAPGGASVPVLGTLEEVTKKIETAKNQTTEEVKHGI